jgi:hypothetical protein
MIHVMLFDGILDLLLQRLVCGLERHVHADTYIVKRGKASQYSLTQLASEHAGIVVHRLWNRHGKSFREFKYARGARSRHEPGQRPCPPQENEPVLQRRFHGIININNVSQLAIASGFASPIGFAAAHQ